MKRKPKSKKDYKTKDAEREVRTGRDRPFREDIKEGKGDMYSQPNDPRWYAANPQVLKDVASFPYGWPLGGEFDLGSLADNFDVNAIPGVMAIYTAPAFGWADNPNAPVNVAARNIFTYVRHANSGSWNYNSPDLMLYLLAMDSMYSYIAWLKRLYGMCAYYSVTNRYYPKALIEANGVDFQDLQGNLNDFRGYINMLAVRAGQFVVPSSMAYTAKHEWMYSGLYTDAATDKPQTYMFVPDGFFQYGLTAITDSGGTIFTSGELSYKKLMPKFGNLTGAPVDYAVGSMTPTKLLTFQDLQAYGDALINPLLQSQDINVMCGDILKAYGDNVHKISGITEDYTVYPAYDMEVLDQIQNATFIGEYAAGTSITQDPTKGWLKFTPTQTYPYAFTGQYFRSPGFNAYWGKKIVNFQHGDVEPAATMEATRLTNIASAQDNANNTLQFNTIGSEIACYGHIYYYGYGDLDAKGQEGAVWQLWRSRTLYLSNTAVIQMDKGQQNVSFDLNALNLTNGSSKVTGALVMGLPALTTEMFTDLQHELADVFRLSHMLTNFDRHPFMAINAGFVIPQLTKPTAAYMQSSSVLSLGAAVEGQTGTVQYLYLPTPVYSMYTGLLGDVSYYTLISRDELQMMAEAALLSMFNPF